MELRKLFLLQVRSFIKMVFSSSQEYFEVWMNWGSWDNRLKHMQREFLKAVAYSNSFASLVHLKLPVCIHDLIDARQLIMNQYKDLQYWTGASDEKRTYGSNQNTTINVSSSRKTITNEIMMTKKTAIHMNKIIRFSSSYCARGLTVAT